MFIDFKIGNLILMLFRGLLTLLRVKFTIKKALRRNVPLHTYFLEHVNNHPNKECVVDIETGKRYTYSEFNKLCNKYANFFKVSHFCLNLRLLDDVL